MWFVDRFVCLWWLLYADCVYLTCLPLNCCLNITNFFTFFNTIIASLQWWFSRGFKNRPSWSLSLRFKALVLACWGCRFYFFWYIVPFFVLHYNFYGKSNRRFAVNGLTRAIRSIETWELGIGDIFLKMQCTFSVFFGAIQVPLELLSVLNERWFFWGISRPCQLGLLKV